MNQPSAELKPCPFCGSRAHVKNFSVPPILPAFVVFCETQQCIGRNSNMAFYTEDRAVEAWNRRIKE